MIYGNCVGGTGLERTYILVDEKGNEVPAVMVDNETSFDATANDIRIGKVAATNSGVTVGEKEIPIYHSTEGYKLVTNGSKFILPIPNYDYTKLQAIFCPYNASVAGSVAADKVVINGCVYPVQSTEPESNVSADVVNQWIDFGITNMSGGLYLIHYFTFKEVY